MKSYINSLIFSFLGTLHPNTYRGEKIQPQKYIFRWFEQIRRAEIRKVFGLMFAFRAVPYMLGLPQFGDFYRGGGFEKLAVNVGLRVTSRPSAHTLHHYAFSKRSAVIQIIV